MKISNFNQALLYLNQYIPRRKKQIYSGKFGLKRQKYFLKLMGNPQNKIKVIHVAGTSGKGSSSYLISALLKNQGFRIGLHISPHLIDLSERLQINNQFISRHEFCRYLNKLIPYINKVSSSKYCSPTYFEILVALAYSYFYDKKVDYAVVETGMGGLYDGTNTVINKNKVCVLTKIGIDHTAILGKTIDKIAYQKAMITQKNNAVISIWQQPKVRKVIEMVVEHQKGTLQYVKRPRHFNYKLGLLGDYQIENAALALAVLKYVGVRDGFIAINDEIKNTLRYAHFPGRMEIFKLKNKIIIIDAAHNPQKMSAFIGSLKKLYPQLKFNFLVAFKKNKDYINILKHIIPIAEKITITSFFTNNQELFHSSEKPNKIIKILKKMGINHCDIAPLPKNALKKMLEQKNKYIVITGSLYLLGTLYSLLK